MTTGRTVHIVIEEWGAYSDAITTVMSAWGTHDGAEQEAARLGRMVGVRGGTPRDSYGGPTYHVEECPWERSRDGD